MEKYNISTLSLHNIYKSFNKSPVLQDITYNFSANATYALVGPSGSGKSTLIYLLSGLEKSDKGSVLFNDTQIDSFSEHQKQHYLNRNIGLIFQQPCLIPELTVLENVLIKHLISNNTIEPTFKEYARELLDKVNILDKADTLPSKLSGGEQQRVAIARALIHKPTFLLADEPTAHLDYENRDKILQVLLSLQKDSCTGLIIATHDQDVAKHLDHKLFLSKGTLNL